MANSAFTHDPQITVPGSSTDNAIVIFDGTAGTGFGNSTILVDSGGNGRIGIAADTNVITLTSGVVTIAGTVAATTLTGAGAGITALAAANITASGTLPALNGAALTALNGSQVTTGTVADARISALTASKLTGALPAIDGSNLTGISAGVANPLTSGSFVLNDNAKLGLGTSSGESEIYSDGTNVYWDTGDDVPIVFRDVTTNSTTKASRLGFGHYTNSEEPVMMMSGNSISSGNALYIGGGRNNMNAVTSIDFYTAANGTTTGGTTRLLIASGGEVTVNENNSMPSVTKGLLKAWVQSTATGSRTGSYNVSGVTDNGTGDWQVLFDPDFESATYALAGLPIDGANQIILRVADATNANRAYVHAVVGGTKTDTAFMVLAAGELT